ncbi:A disintegrin and metalloproteinase with thrombospondin motifs 2-like isoform X1 [Babylonia areolata]|uniref:A disintegrin and metalloproteinase with thrombospondin motifs 2-like isoform X1 n=1 Tax=Babylonia areolata TaxID=304850 RepID=UPI003FCF10F6
MRCVVVGVEGLLVVLLVVLTIVKVCSCESLKAAFPIPAPCQPHRAEIVFPTIASTPTSTPTTAGGHFSARSRKPEAEEEDLPRFLHVRLTWRRRHRRLTLLPSDVTSWRTVTLYDDDARNDTVAETGGGGGGGRCQYQGFVRGEEDSFAALSVCQGLAGFLQMGGEMVFVEPVTAPTGGEEGRTLWEGRRPHIFYSCLDPDMPASNATDTSDSAEETSSPHGPHEEERYRRGQRRRRRKRTLRLGGGEGEGAEGGRSKRSSGEGRRRYLEVQLVVDHTVVAMHGHRRVQHYVLTLMNIANSVYQHPSLGVDIRVVVTELVLLQQREQKEVLVKKDAFGTVRKFCEWSHGRHPPTRAIRHDIAVLLTRENLGPAGYAPITGMCNPSRACAAVTEEGFTSGFIIAHEMAHVFGLVHDGEGSPCRGPAYSTAIMAPLVEAKINRFRWSQCSRARMQEVIPHLFCLDDNPDIDSGLDDHYDLDSGHLLPDDVGRQWSLSFQCRMEFGYRSRLCSAFSEDACNVLWCSDSSSPYLCRTKRGPPMPGSNCGYSMECRNRRCEYVGKERAVHGGWSPWGEWGDCSVHCGIGIKRRRRFCSNPRPTYGGRPCSGAAEDWDTCVATKPRGIILATQLCRKGYDQRAVQCAAWNELNMRHGQHDWKPHPAKRERDRCKQTCISSTTREVVTYSSPIADGTPCDYNTTDICYRGRCLAVGCDGVRDSNKTFDSCGVCGGDHSRCKTVSGHFVRHPSSEDQYEPVLFLPEGSRHIEVVRRGSANQFIALRDPEEDRYVLNGNQTREDSRDFVEAGALWEYERKFAFQSLRSTGPLYGSLEVMLYPDHDFAEASVSYEYSVTKEDTTLERYRYFWRHKGWSPCSVSCGEGVKREVQVCYDRDTGEEEREDMCRYLPPPTLLTLPCSHDPCSQKKYVWTLTEAWSTCNATQCGQGGVQTQGYVCQAHYSNNHTYLTVDSSLCDPRTVPMVTRNCSAPPCGLTWTVGEWSECSVTCGQGRQWRTAYCGDPLTDSDDVWCKDSPPPLSKTCDMGLCNDIPDTLGDDECRDKLSQCGQSLEVGTRCQSRLFQDMCCQTCRRQLSAARRPRLSQRAVHKWVLTDRWSPCSAKQCGEEGEELREYQCRVYFRHNRTALTVPPDHCGHPTTAPRLARPCSTPPCDLRWSTGPWSQCSVTCGQGRQWRTAYCGDPLTDSDDVWCKDSPPSLSRMCNKGRCKGVKGGHFCSDKYTFCRHARGLSLKCLSKGFRRICCSTCRRSRRNARRLAARKRTGRKLTARRSAAGKPTARKPNAGKRTAHKRTNKTRDKIRAAARKRASNKTRRSKRRVVNKHLATGKGTSDKRAAKNSAASKGRAKPRTAAKNKDSHTANKRAENRHDARRGVGDERSAEVERSAAKQHSAHTPFVSMTTTGEPPLADAPSQWDLYRQSMYRDEEY